jgi:HK97 family phage major capsid protein
MGDTKRDQLSAVKEQIKDATARRADAIKERDAARDSFSGVDLTKPGFVETKDFKDAEQAVLAVGKIDNELDDLRLAETRILQLFGDDPAAGSDANPALESPRRGWDAWSLLGKDGQESGYQNAKKLGIFTSANKFGTVHLGEIASREEAASFLTGRPLAVGTTTDLPAAPAGPVTTGDVGNAIRPDWRGVVQPLLRTFSFLDLLPVGTTDSNNVEYVQVTAIPGSAAPVAEGDLKPQQGLGLEDANAPVRTIAGWIKLLRQAMDDTAGLATLIQTLLPWDVRRQIEAQVIAGNGVGQNLLGLLNQPGIHHIDETGVANVNDADRILMAMTLVILSGGVPNFAAVNPITWQNMLLLREDTSGAGSRTGMYLFGGPGSIAAPRVWGLALTPSVAVAGGASLVGDTSGLTLLFREGVNIKTSDSDQDDFIRNRVTILAEARVACPVWRPASFAVAAEA